MVQNILAGSSWVAVGWKCFQSAKIIKDLFLDLESCLHFFVASNKQFIKFLNLLMLYFSGGRVYSEIL